VITDSRNSCSMSER